MVRVDRGVPTNATKAPARAPLPSRFGSTQKMSANINVVVRVRPMNDKEKELNHRLVVDVVDNKMLVFDPKEQARPFFYQGVQQPNKDFLKRANKELKFVFDHVCDMGATNDEVFENTTKAILSSLMEGYNCSVFAYGATGAGKTFTMIGNIDNPGITYLTMDHLFLLMNSLETDREFEIAVSYIEVYNENVYDLLKPSSVPLQLREDSKYGVMVAGLTLHSIKTARELLNMLENGNKNRTQHPTDANAESSRSHAVFQVYLNMRYKTSGEVRIVKLSMIDLAGSERASATGCVGDRFKEGANINKSLLSLGNCINKLADGSNYIPYRDSKLTRLLKDSLGGNCKTVMIANISPSSISYEDTYNTLKYATRASKIQLSIKKNIVEGDMRVSQYTKVIEELKKRVQMLEAKLSIAETKPVEAAVKVDTSKEKAMQEWRRRIVAAEAEAGEAERAALGRLAEARVAALRRRLRARAAHRFAQLAHRSSNDAMGQRCAEDIPRDERSAEYYKKQAVELDAEVSSARARWEPRRRKLDAMLDAALTECPDLADFVLAVQQRTQIRLLRARDDLLCKLLSIENTEIAMTTEYMRDMPKMLKKLFLTLKGYDKVPPSLTEEYLEVMRQSKAKGITWSDADNENNAQLKFLTNLDLDNPIMMADCDFTKDLNGTIDLESEESKENCPVATFTKKRKGTPIKLTTNETIVINDSFEMLDTTRNLNSTKKLKVDDVGTIDPNNLNSTFVMADKKEPVKKTIHFEAETASNVPKCNNNRWNSRAPLRDGTNTLNSQRTVNFGDKGKAVRPVVGRATQFRWPPAPGAATGPAGFGSSLARDGGPLYRNVQEGNRRNNVTQRPVGFKAVRGRERTQNHPYSRPPPLSRR